jgi:hypothetical protein
MNIKEEIFLQIRLRYRREKIHNSLVKSKAPASFLQHSEKCVQKSLNRFSELGITEKMYKKYIDKLWMLFEETDMELDRMHRCEKYQDDNPPDCSKEDKCLECTEFIERRKSG